MKNGAVVMWVLVLISFLSLLGSCNGQPNVSTTTVKSVPVETQTPIPTTKTIVTTSTVVPTSTTPTTSISSTLSIAPSPSINPTPSPTSSMTTIPPKTLVSLVEWQSVEENKGIISGPILKFAVSSDGNIYSLEVSTFPVEGEWFWTFSAEPLTIQDNKFTFTKSSRSETDNGLKFVLEGTFISDTEWKGTMTFPKGFFWVDFAVPQALTITWTAHPK
jgi:hypothetical protein